MRNRFDLQLKQLNDDIIEMGNMIERAIEMGVYALIGHDTDKAKQTIDYDMDIDHIIPQKYGGRDSVLNLQCICKHCNRSKQASLRDTPKDLFGATKREVKSYYNN